MNAVRFCISDIIVIKVDWLKIVERLQHRHYYVAFILGFGIIPIYIYIYISQLPHSRNPYPRPRITMWQFLRMTILLQSPVYSQGAIGLCLWWVQESLACREYL